MSPTDKLQKCSFLYISAEYYKFLQNAACAFSAACAAEKSKNLQNMYRKTVEEK